MTKLWKGKKITNSDYYVYGRGGAKTGWRAGGEGVRLRFKYKLKYTYSYYSYF